MSPAPGLAGLLWLAGAFGMEIDCLRSPGKDWPYD